MSQLLPLLGLLCAKRRKNSAKCRDIGARDVVTRKNNDLADYRMKSSGGAGLDSSNGAGFCQGRYRRFSGLIPNISVEFSL